MHLNICLVGERADHLQRSFFSATIIAYRTVDSSSEAFELVRRDNLDALVRLIALQKASARDCDADGRSLLFVSAPANSYDFRRTILSHAADMLLS